MAYNKVIYKGETLIDLTQDTVTAETLAVGATAHNAAGEVIEGTFEGSGNNEYETATVTVISELGSDGINAFISIDGSYTEINVGAYGTKTYTIKVPAVCFIKGGYSIAYSPTLQSGEGIQIDTNIVYIAGNCTIDIYGESAGPI